MAFEDIKLKINMLLDETQQHPEDWHELAQQVHQQLDEMRGMGLPLPADLVGLEEALQREAGRQSSGGK